MRLAEMNQFSVQQGGKSTSSSTTNININNVVSNNNNNNVHSTSSNGTTTTDDNECVVREQDRFMPIANVIRIMRKILPPHAKISDDAKETIQECVSEYISFITGEANERCQREQRKTITAEDVLWAMSKLGFDDYIEPLTLYLHRYREMEGERGSGSSTTSIMRSDTSVKGAASSSSRAIDHHQYYAAAAAAAAAFHHHHGHAFFGYLKPSDASTSTNNNAALPNGDHHQPHANDRA